LEGAKAERLDGVGSKTIEDDEDHAPNYSAFASGTGEGRSHGCILAPPCLVQAKERYGLGNAHRLKSPVTFTRS